jgi:NADPH:quinone reductase-like Zn-dependent oxidoreductase
MPDKIIIKRIQYHRYGGPEELRMEEVSLPETASGQIRIRVKAAAANPVDWKLRKGEMKLLTGRRFPRGVGLDFAGVVDVVGPNVTSFKVGDEVFGATGLKQSGAFAEALITETKTVYAKPKSLTFEEAASLPVVSVTAWNALIDKANLQAGQRVLITGCLGGVGRIAAQIAVMRGATITGSCNESRREEALALGIAEVIDYCNFNADKYRGLFDVVFDTHGALSLRQCDEMLTHSGMALHIVPTALKMIRSMVSAKHNVVFGHPTPETFAGITEAIERGKLTPAIGRIAPLSEAISAITELEMTGMPKGKLVIVSPVVPSL